MPAMPAVRVSATLQRLRTAHAHAPRLSGIDIELDPPRGCGSGPQRHRRRLRLGDHAPRARGQTAAQTRFSVPAMCSRAFLLQGFVETVLAELAGHRQLMRMISGRAFATAAVNSAAACGRRRSPASRRLPRVLGLIIDRVVPVIPVSRPARGVDQPPPNHTPVAPARKTRAKVRLADRAVPPPDDIAAGVKARPSEGNRPGGWEGRAPVILLQGAARIVEEDAGAARASRNCPGRGVEGEPRG